jgi:NADH dehydrogenase
MKKRIIIIGGGFAGMKLARKLGNTPYDVLLIDKHNFHQFQPLFYQVATARLDASNISFPLRKAFDDIDNVNIRIAEVQRIEPATNTVITDLGPYPYDYLVLACGADTNYFGNADMQKYSYPMKSTLEALAIRMHLLQNFEDMYRVKDNDARIGLLNYVIVGGGPTGVETAGALMEMKKHVLPSDFHDMDFGEMNIYLVEAGSKLLSAMSPSSSEKSQKYLEDMGVHVLLNTQVNTYDGKNVVFADGKTIRTDTLIWAAGVKANSLEGLDPAVIVRGGRVKVDRINKVEGYENIFAVGDVCYMETPDYPKGHPQVANVAISQAVNLGQNLKAMLKDQAPRMFEYTDKGTLATIGRSKAVADIPRPRLHFGGFFAWLVWMGVHLVLLMGMKNRIQVFTNWAAAYFTRNSSLRLIFEPYLRSKNR